MEQKSWEAQSISPVRVFSSNVLCIRLCLMCRVLDCYKYEQKQVLCFWISSPIENMNSALKNLQPRIALGWGFSNWRFFPKNRTKTASTKGQLRPQFSPTHISLLKVFLGKYTHVLHLLAIFSQRLCWFIWFYENRLLKRKSAWSCIISGSGSLSNYSLLQK